jgi:hypothetical protein
MDAKTEVCTRDRLRDLADQPGVTVYEYVNDTAAEVMPADAQLYVFKAITAAFDAGVVAHPSESTEAVRERVLNASPKARKFQNLYPKVFASVTVRVSTDEEEERLDRVRKAVMLMILEKVTATGSEDEIAARVMHHSMRLAMRDTTAADLESGTVLNPGERGLPEMVPMHPKELGPSSVHQKPA